MGKADDMTEALTPLMREGNPHAALALLRLSAAADPDAGVDRILGEWQPVIDTFVRIGREMADAFVRGLARDRFPVGE